MKPMCTSAVLVAAMALGPGGLRAEERTGEGRSRAPAPAGWETVVHAPRLTLGSTALEDDALLAEPGANVGVLLSRRPGGAATRRGADAAEPVLRGLGGERVQTQLAGMPMYGACPSKMDPPIIYLESLALDRLVITPGLPSVVDGPVGLGGSLQASFDYHREATAPPEGHAQLAGAYDSARDGGQLAAAVSGGHRHADIKATVSGSKLGDYRSGNGRLVPAASEHLSATGSVGLRLTPRQRWWHGMIARRDGPTAFPALPMDAVSNELFFFGTSHTTLFHGPLLRRVLLRGAVGHLTHVMDNARKANRGQLEARTPSTTTTFAAGARAELEAAAGLALRVGVDANGVLRDATRTRVIVASGRTFRDHLWPEAEQLDVGLFAEAELAPTAALSWRNGARLDVVASDAAAADDVVAGSPTVVSQYERFYGPVAGEVQRTEVVGAANSLLQWLPVGSLALHAGAGFVTRPASLTERYFAFGPVPGGFQVGNPALDPERKLSLELGGRWISRWLTLRSAASYAFVHDFILPSELTREDLDGDGVDDSVRGFRNVDAHLLSCELLATLRPLPLIELPLGVGYTWGRNASGDRPLPEIPPLWAQAAIRLLIGQQARAWIETGVRVSAAQRLVDRAFPEDPTDAYALLHVRGGVELSEALRLELIGENLLDTTYNDHLMREAVLPAGDLAAGDEIPEPGRRVLITLRGQL